MLTREEKLYAVGNALEILHEHLTFILYKPHQRDDPEKTQTLLRRYPFLTLFRERAPVPLELVFEELEVPLILGSLTSSLAYLGKRSQFTIVSLLPFYVRTVESIGGDTCIIQDNLASLPPVFGDVITWVATEEQLAITCEVAYADRE